MPVMSLSLAIAGLMLCVATLNKISNQQDESIVITQCESLRNEMLPIFLECEANIARIKTTQDDAVNTLSNSFDTLEDLVRVLVKIISKAQADSQVSADLEEVSTQLLIALNDAIRALQFGDINGQNLTFTQGEITFLRTQIQTISFDNLEQTLDQINAHVHQLQKRKHNNHNPVSATSMAAGDIDLF